MKIGRLEILEEKIINNRKYCYCLCECGKTKLIRKDVIGKKTFSCGCLAKEKTHYKTNTRLHMIWSNMKRRCYNKNDKDFYNYGARGIDVCNEWNENFMNFYNWALSNGYDDKLTIDRIDNDKGYCPENCRWVDLKTQCNNRKTNRYIEYNGEKHTISEWSELYNINYHTFCSRLYRGWKFEDIINKTKGII